MAFENLLHLSNDLEWLGVELEQIGHVHALQGYPHAGETWKEFQEKQKGVLLTCDKIEHQLKDTVRYDTGKLVGIALPVDDALNAIAQLLEAVEKIKWMAVYQVHDLPEAVRCFNQMVHGAFGQAAPTGATE